MNFKIILMIKIILISLIVAAMFLLTACSNNNTNDNENNIFPADNNLCDISKCGPALGMPNTICSDGKTIGGPTGRCLKNADESCGWEIIRCPEPKLNYDVAEVTNVSCAIDNDCETPMTYLLRSSCPYTSKCLEEKCAVVCPKFVGTGYADVRDCGSCPQYSSPSPNFCSVGKVVLGKIDECGCQGPPSCELVACTMEAKLCPDGHAVGRVGPNCEFEPC
jgi:hypothetical protein